MLSPTGLGGGANIFASNSVDHVIWGGAQELRDDGELVDMVLSGKEGLALEHLGKDAAGAPNVHLDVVLLPREHDLGRAVVPGRHVARHLGVLDSGEAKVADLEIAVLVDQDVARLQVTVDHARRVDILETTLRSVSPSSFGSRWEMAHHDLVEKVLDELLLQRPRSEKPVQIRPEKLGYKVAAHPVSLINPCLQPERVCSLTCPLAGR